LKGFTILEDEFEEMKVVDWIFAHLKQRFEGIKNEITK